MHSSIHRKLPKMANPTPKASPLSLIVLEAIVMLLFCPLFINSAMAKATVYNVVNFGAKPDGQTYSTTAFLSAWHQACGSAKPAAIYVPRGRFLVGSATFSGQCNNKAISITIDGALVAPSDYQVIGNTESWLLFDHVSGVAIHGGVLDGQGTGLWSCKNSGKSCPLGATTLTFNNSDHIVIAGLTSINSQMFHILFKGCQNVHVHGAKVMASGNSPNTDGIHIQFSSDVTILDSRIQTGDDCVSVGPGTTNLWIEEVACGPGHGISIGSLGWEFNEPGVKNVTVRTVTFSKTQNGVRIKCWGRPSNGFVRDIHFEHAIMDNVQNPIVIDQNYCPFYQGCPGEPSGIQISDVTYKDIQGTSATQVAVRFDCSSKQPCIRIRLEDVKLTYKDQGAVASCNHAAGTASGSVQPESCL